MKSRRFDDLARALAATRSRRSALQQGGAGLAAMALGLAATTRANAQEATPVATTSPSDYLFVQTFTSGALTPGETAGAYTLTLTGGNGQTIYFANRPDRHVGTVPTENFLIGDLFDPANPPNAAVVAQTPEGEDILVVELTTPALDDSTGEVTYEAVVLAEYPGGDLDSLAMRQEDDQLPESFGPVSLFIDDAICLPDNTLYGWILQLPGDPTQQEAACRAACCTGSCFLFGIGPTTAWFCGT